tara:strand:- start:1539 stop:2381 length:843 start_codon:yes stop_codon:yes gene_type:complete
MNYIIIHTGEIPEYISQTFNSILTIDKNAKIFFCSDGIKKYKNIENVNISDIKSNQTKEIESLNFYKETPWHTNPLWITSLMRVFYLNDAIDNLNLKQGVHFDSDVIIYKPYEKIEQSFDQNKFNITPLNNEELIFGYAYFGNKNILNEIVNKFTNVVKNEFGSMVNEMKLLKSLQSKSKEIFNLLNILPDVSEEYVFDPASYGQYLGGTHANPYRFYKRRWAGDHHYIGKEIIENQLTVKFKKYPYVLKENKKYEIVNLHIHSKELRKFLPQGYKNYLI